MIGDDTALKFSLREMRAHYRKGMTGGKIVGFLYGVSFSCAVYAVVRLVFGW